MSLRFVREFLRNPSQIGAVWPSSVALAERMVAASRVRTASLVVEIGPGTGAFTKAILRDLPANCDFIAIERSPDLAKHLSERFPGVNVTAACASTLPEILQGRKACAIVSGLPWAAFPHELQTQLLNAITQTLAADGIFTTFAYYGPHRLAAGRRLGQRLSESFGEVRRSPVVLANLPPAFVYSCSAGAPPQQAESTTQSHE